MLGLEERESTPRLAGRYIDNVKKLTEKNTNMLLNKLGITTKLVQISS